MGREGRDTVSDNKTGGFVYSHLYLSLRSAAVDGNLGRGRGSCRGMPVHATWMTMETWINWMQEV